MNGRVPMTSPVVHMSGTTGHIGTTVRVSPKMDQMSGPIGHVGTTLMMEHPHAQTSEAREQNAKDEAYVEQYYHKQTERRKRYRVNRKEHVWQAEERLAMSFNDFRPADEVAVKLSRQATAPTANKPQSHTTEAEAPVDKSWITPSMPLVEKTPLENHFYVDTGNAALKQQSSSLASSFRLVATNLDAGFGKKRKWDDAPTAASSQKMTIRLQTLPGPISVRWKCSRHRTSTHKSLSPRASYPQHRTFGYSRVVPKMDGKYCAAKSQLKTTVWD